MDDRRRLRITVSKELMMEIAVLSIDVDQKTNILCEKLLKYAIDNIDRSVLMEGK